MSQGRLCFRVVFDKPVGICLGFRPGGIKVDYWAVIDRGGDQVFVKNDQMLIIGKEDRWPSEGWGKEDLLVWRTPDEFFQWMTDYR